MIGAAAAVAAASGLRAQAPGLAGVISAHAAKGFNGTVLVGRGDSIVYHEAFGIADRTFGVPAARGTRYRIAFSFLIGRTAMETS